MRSAPSRAVEVTPTHGGSGSASAIASSAVPCQLDPLSPGPPATRRGDVFPSQLMRLGKVVANDHGHDVCSPSLALMAWISDQLLAED